MPGRLVAALVALAVSFGPAAAQPATGGDLSASLHLGASRFDLAGTGTAVTAAVRGAVALTSLLALEGSLGWVRPAQQFQPAPNSLWTTELQLQLALPRPISPFVGLGTGLAVQTGRVGDVGVQSTTSVSAGLRAGVNARWRVIAEFRARGIGDKFQGTASEWTLGVSRSF